MKILVVEDDSNKSALIMRFLRTEFPTASVTAAQSYQSGLKAALGDTFDAIILDMSLPTYDISASNSGGRTRGYGGREFLEALKRRRRNTKVVVVTQFDTFGEGADAMNLTQLTEQLRAEYPDIYVGTAFYQASQTAWRDELQAYLKSVSGDLS
ncbi:response regulator [Anaeromyxobacter dehalogenans]|nr:response regulator [Anaeromyxobacter dehalogenans]